MCTLLHNTVEHLVTQKRSVQCPLCAKLRWRRKFVPLAQLGYRTTDFFNGTVEHLCLTNFGSATEMCFRRYRKNSDKNACQCAVHASAETWNIHNIAYVLRCCSCFTLFCASCAAGACFWVAPGASLFLSLSSMRGLSSSLSS